MRGTTKMPQNDFFASRLVHRVACTLVLLACTDQPTERSQSDGCCSGMSGTLSGSRLPVDCCQPRCLKVRNRTQVLSTRIYPNSFLKPGSTWAVATSAMIPRAGIVVFEILDFEILARGARN